MDLKYWDNIITFQMYIFMYTFHSVDTFSVKFFDPTVHENDVIIWKF